MTPERYERISEIFGEATELPAAERGPYLDRTCGDDDELMREVLALLAHHDPDPEGPADVPAPSASRFPRIGFHRRRKRNRPLLLSAITAAGVLAVIGIITHWIVAPIQRTQLKNQLTTVLDADVAAAQLWIDFVIETTERWSDNPVLKETAAQMLERANDGGDPAELVKSEANRRFLDLLAPVTNLSALRGAHLMHPSLGVLATTPVGGKLQSPKLNAGLVAPLFRSMQGETVFTPPYLEHSKVVMVEASERIPIVNVVTPVFGKTGQPILLLCLRWRVDERFARLISLARLGETGETYAFDRAGVVVTPLRHEARLRELGVIAADAPPGTALNVLLRDPGGDLGDGHRQADPREALPLTRMAAQATTGISGFDLDGYRDFSGRKVVGAWRWLEEYEFGIATEISYSEAYVASRSMRKVFAGLFVVLLGTAAFAFARERIHIGLRSELDQLRDIGPYQVEGVLGKGGMGTVYRGEHRLLKRPTAIKIIREDKVGPRAIKRFEREVMGMSRLTNPHTVQVYDFGVQQDGSLYYAMEYLDGRTLEKLVEGESTLPWARAVFLLKQICGSLIEAHASGLIHRDLKPQNIMVTCLGGEADFVKVFDFGLVKDLDSQDASGSTSSGGGMIGTPQYMAPERMRDPQGADERSDVYSLGAICHYMLTGERAFEGVNALDTCFRAMTEEPPEITDGNGIPETLIELTKRCFAADPAARPAGVGEFLQILEALPATGWDRAMARIWWGSHKNC